MRPLVAFAVVLLAAPAASAQTGGETPTDPLGVLMAMSAHANAGEVEAAAAYYAPSMTFTHVMRERMAHPFGREQMAAGLAAQKGTGIQRDVLDPRVSGPFVSFEMRTTTGPDDEGDVDLWVFEVKDGLIVNMWHFDPSGVEAAYAEADTDE